MSGRPVADCAARHARLAIVSSQRKKRACSSHREPPLDQDGPAAASVPARSDVILPRRRNPDTSHRLVVGVYLIAFAAYLTSQPPRPRTVGRVQQLAPDVYFYEGDISKGHCNNGWVVFEDYVLVIDANFPSGAREVIAKIRELTKKPIRFAFDTHHHGDHAYGNQVWVDEGATPVAHTGVLEEMKRLETGACSADAPGRWEDDGEGTRGRSRLEAQAADAALSRHADLRRRDAPRGAAALRHGAHQGRRRRVAAEGEDPLHRRLAVNGPYNFLGDGDIASWIRDARPGRRARRRDRRARPRPSGTRRSCRISDVLPGAAPRGARRPARVRRRRRSRRRFRRCGPS